jgi:hypothetical protein
MTRRNVRPADNPYRINGFFVGRCAELAAIRNHLASGQSTLLIGGRRAGKTFLASRLTDVGRKLIALDAGGWELDSEQNVLTEIGAGLDQLTDAKRPRRLYTREMLTKRLKQIGPVAIVIDEADRILGEPWAGKFLSYLRFLDDTELRSTIAFLLIGGPCLAEYRNPDDQGSPPLNTADPVYLEPLTKADVSKMVVNLPAGVTVEKVMEEAGGHPWLINRLLAEVWDGRKFQQAADDVWDRSVGNFKVWHRQVGEKGVAFLRVLPRQGLRIAEFRTGPMSQHREALLRCRYTCLVQRGDKETYRPGPQLFLNWLSSDQGKTSAWDLAISYASENRKIAQAIFDQLRTQFKVFFAAAERAYLWGQDLNKALPNTYGVESRFVLVLSSATYVRKHWTRVEFAAARNSLGDGRILIVKLGALPPDTPRDLVFMESNPENLLSLIDSLKRKLSNTHG